MWGMNVVGWTDLEAPMEHGRSAAGVLEAGHGYALVKGVFDLYRSAGPRDRAALAAYLQALDALNLTLYESSSLPLAAQVELISEWESGRKVIHVSVTDERYWVSVRIQGRKRFD